MPGFPVRSNAVIPFLFLLMLCVRPSLAQAGERILYNINPVGKAEYNDLGLQVVDGRTVRVATFRTRVVGFDDTETITSDPSTALPIKVERRINWRLRREHIIESYDQAHQRLTIIKYRGDRAVWSHDYAPGMPIHNAILFPFQVRNIPDPKIGWRLTAAFPSVFTFTLVSIDTVKTPAGKFRAYHFTSDPHKLDIWISADEHRIPVKIVGTDNIMKLTRYIPDGGT